MTERRMQDDGTEPVVARLDRHFSREVTRAERDVPAALMPVHAGARRRSPLMRMVVLGALIAAVAAVVAFPLVGDRPTVSPPAVVAPSSSEIAASDGSPAPSASPPPSSAPAWKSPDVTARFADGIPSRINGEEVVRASEGIVAARREPGSRSLLIAGYHGSAGFVGGCEANMEGATPAPTPPPPFHPRRCAEPPRDLTRISDLPTTVVGAGWRLVHETKLGGVPDGPVILRVHTHDPRSRGCPEHDRSFCRDAIVVEALVWAGDDVTSAAPLDISRVVRELEWRDPDSHATSPRSVVPYRADEPAACTVPWPKQRYRIVGDARLGLVLVFPSTADRERLQTSFPASVPLDAGCLYPYLHREQPSRWVAVENVMVQVIGEDDVIAERVGDALRGDAIDEEHRDDIPAWAQDIAVEQRLRATLDVRAAGAFLQAAAMVQPAAGSTWQEHEERFVLDAVRRQEKRALDYDLIEPVPGLFTEAHLGTPLWRELQDRAGIEDARVFVVRHHNAIDPRLVEEQFVVVRYGDGTHVVAVARGEPYPPASTTP